MSLLRWYLLIGYTVRSLTRFDVCTKGNEVDDLQFSGAQFLIVAYDKGGCVFAAEHRHPVC